MSSLSWLGKTLCPPDCLVKSDIKAPSCAAIFRLGIVVLQCVRTGEVFCGLHVAHVHIICPVRDVTHVRKCTRPSPAFPYCKRRKAGRGPGNEASLASLGINSPARFQLNLEFDSQASRYRVPGLDSEASLSLRMTRFARKYVYFRPYYIIYGVINVDFNPSLVPRPRGKREKWPGIHCLRMREKPHDFMGYRIPSFTNR